jgi:hypothetical protein
MKEAIRVVLLALAVSPGWVVAQATAPASDLPAEVRILVKQLSDDSYRVRQEAEDRLVRFGQGAKPALRELLAATRDPEARTRAESALARIDEDRATGPSLVTVRAKEASPESVLAQLSAQAGFDIPTLPENLFKQEHIRWPAVTMDVERQPFLMALRQFCEKTNLRPNAMGNDRKFVLMQGGDESMLGPAVYHGAFMVVANSVTRSSNINFGRDKAPSKTLNVQFSFFAEPKLNILGHDYQLRLTEAVDDQGNSLLLPGPPNHHSMGQDTSGRWSLGAALAIPDNLGSKLKVIKGVNRVLMRTGSETWEVPDVSTAPTPTRSLAGRRYVVEDFKALPNDSYQFKLTIIREAPESEPWQQFGRGVKVTLLDADGKQLSSRGYGGGGSDERVSHTYTFARDVDHDDKKTGPAAKLVVEIPTEVKEVEIPFEFTDLPLP